ncbi:MAG TPA: acyl-CoA dehydrogenase family protein [Pseudomonas sp.]|nr:acyl-CoA dehydrogenase family protein [Pseudomonas sp.]
MSTLTLPECTVSVKQLGEGGWQAAMDVLIEQVRLRRLEFDQGKHVPVDVINLMKKAGIFRASTPACFGGEPLPPAELLRRVERISEVDGSAGWVSAFGSANTYLARLPYETQKLLYATGPDQVFAGGLFPPHYGEAVEGGWILNGRWKFASGCKGADWMGVGIKVDSPDGKSPPSVRMAVMPATEVEIVESWDVVGMQGTGSHDLRLENTFVAHEWTCQRELPSPIDEPLYRYPALAYQAQVHAVVNIGLARAALDTVIEMGGGAKIIPGASRLADRAYYRTSIAQCEAKLRSARAFFYETAEQAWDMLISKGELTRELHSLVLLSAAHAAHTSTDIVQEAYRIAGIGVIQKSHRLQAIARDSMVITQHAALSLGTFDAAGSIFVGVEPVIPYV